MTSGVPLELQEVQRIKALVIETMESGVGSTLMGAIRRATSLEINGNVVPYAACSERIVFYWLEEDREFKAAVNAARKFGNRKIIDLAQSKLVARINNDSDINEQGRMVRFALERLGKDDGYAPRTEHTGKDGAPLRGMDDKLPPSTDQEALDAALAIQQHRPEE